MKMEKLVSFPWGLPVLDHALALHFGNDFRLVRLAHKDQFLCLFKGNMR